MKHLQISILAILLVLILVGVVGHAVLPVSGSHHALSESTCAFHHGMAMPGALPPAWIEPGVSIEPGLDSSCAFDLVLNIPHPPTI